MAAKDSLGKQFGFRTEHTKWWDVAGHAEAELEKGNEFPDVSEYQDHEGIWVTHKKGDARRYGDDIRQVDLSGAKMIHQDDDGGYFYVRPKSR